MDYRLYWILLLTFCSAYSQAPDVMQELMCQEVVADQSYSCEGLGLQNVPSSIPLTTEILDFSFNSLYALYDSTFSRLRNLTYLNLARCNINWIYDYVFQSNIHLKTIILIGNPVLYIKDYAFSGAIPVSHLFLQQTSLTNVSKIKVTNLNALENLNFGHNFISSVWLPDTLPTRNLQTLDFRFNVITKITTKDTEILKNIKNLSLLLIGNNIDYIEPNSFNSSVLNILDLTACGQNANLSDLLGGLNGLTTNILRIGTFENMKKKFPVTPNTLHGLCNISVNEVDLQHTHFDQLSPNTFFCLSKVQKLDLTNTWIDCFPKFNNSLRDLILHKNEFNSLCDIKTESLTLLTSLHVRYNQKMISMGTGCLKNLQSLQFLDLSHSIEETKACCSNHSMGLVALKYLNLSSNGRLTLSQHSFPDSDNLEVLDFAYTHIFIPESFSPFSNLKLLKVLNMSHSYINGSNDHILEGLHNLSYLNLKKCSFYSGVIKESNLFKHAVNLKDLILSSCEITAIEEHAFSNLKKLTYVDLSQNQLLQFSSNAFGDLSYIYLNFAFNRITIIPFNLVHNIGNQSIINLSHNPLDCSCSNTQFISWYMENLKMFEDNSNTVCWSPQSANGTMLSMLKINCKTSSGVIFVIILAVIVVIIIIIVAVRYYRKKLYSVI
ncbi:CD180 antigen [Pelobates fuscus]|uniref:CD180 antigen n=1 Tax=Pelobates fuscus TaxID=191477 RepID=UPI002FE4E572